MTLGTMPQLKSIKTLKTKSSDVTEKAEDTSASLALRNANDNTADHAVISLSLDILGAENNNRENPRYKNIFLKPKSILRKNNLR